MSNSKEHREADEIRRLAATGLGVKQLCDRFKHGSRTIRHVIAGGFLPQRNKVATKEQVEEILNMRSEGKSVREIMDAFELGEWSIRNILTQAKDEGDERANFDSRFRAAPAAPEVSAVIAETADAALPSPGTVASADPFHREMASLLARGVQPAKAREQAKRFFDLKKEVPVKVAPVPKAPRKNFGPYRMGQGLIKP